MSRSLHQLCQHRIGVDLEDAGHGADAEPFGESGDGPYQHLRRDALPLKRRAVGFLKICVTLDALKLTPRLATGMPIGADIPPAWPTIIGAIVRRTKVVLCVDRAAPPICERQ